jgi:hypothetical protein
MGRNVNLQVTSSTKQHTAKAAISGTDDLENSINKKPTKGSAAISLFHESAVVL